MFKITRKKALNRKDNSKLVIDSVVKLLNRFVGVDLKHKLTLPLIWSLYTQTIRC